MANRQLSISQEDFDEMARVMAEILKSHGVTDGDVDTIIGEIEKKRSIIVNRSAA